MIQTEEKPITSLIAVPLKRLFHKEAFCSAAASPQRTMLAAVGQSPHKVSDFSGHICAH